MIDGLAIDLIDVEDHIGPQQREGFSLLFAVLDLGLFQLLVEDDLGSPLPRFHVIGPLSNLVL